VLNSEELAAIESEQIKKKARNNPISKYIHARRIAKWLPISASKEDSTKEECLI